MGRGGEGQERQEKAQLRGWSENAGGGGRTLAFEKKEKGRRSSRGHGLGGVVGFMLGLAVADYTT